MRRVRMTGSILAAVLLAALLPAATSGASAPPLPSSMAAVGDSISQAMSSGGSLGVDYPANAWSTGTNTAVDSHYLRLAALNPSITGHAWNDAVSGAKVADLAAQVQVAAGQRPDYLTVLIGGNDLCTDTVGQMTSAADFRTRFTAAMDALVAASPATSVYVVSIPNVYQLWDLFHSSFWARTVWSLGSICQSLLANPTSTQTADVQRRAQVAQRNLELNAVLAEVCARYAQCRFDGNAVYNVRFAKSDVSGDYFHPSVAGQAKLAAVSWAAGYWATAGLPTVHLAAATGSSATRKSGWTATVTVSAADGSGDPVRGATISGAWSTGGTGSCVTATNGSCSFSLAVARKTPSVMWTVGSVTATGSVYDASANAGSPVSITAP